MPQAGAPMPEPLEIEICAAIARSGLFDADYYLIQNPDVELSGIDPILHYVRYGESEHRNPAAAFDLELYLPLYGQNALYQHILRLNSSEHSPEFQI